MQRISKVGSTVFARSKKLASFPSLLSPNLDESALRGMCSLRSDTLTPIFKKRHPHIPCSAGAHSPFEETVDPSATPPASFVLPSGQNSSLLSLVAKEASKRSIARSSSRAGSPSPRFQEGIEIESYSDNAVKSPTFEEPERFAFFLYSLLLQNQEQNTGFHRFAEDIAGSLEKQLGKYEELLREMPVVHEELRQKQQHLTGWKDTFQMLENVSMSLGILTGIALFVTGAPLAQCAYPMVASGGIGLLNETPLWSQLAEKLADTKKTQDDLTRGLKLGTQLVAAMAALLSVTLVVQGLGNQHLPQAIEELMSTLLHSAKLATTPWTCLTDMELTEMRTRTIEEDVLRTLYKNNVVRLTQVMEKLSEGEGTSDENASKILRSLGGVLQKILEA
ncbi:MAG: hypothetical protein AAGF04_03855 [Chlamydiota bacterium]